MTLYQFRKLLSALWILFLLVSCDNGGSGMMAGGGIGGTGVISRGTITAFGSIMVNGTEFDTSNAAIVINGEELGVGDEIARESLDIGRVVIVEGTGDLDDTTAEAVRVTYNDNVRGPVESIQSIDATTQEIVVLGQIVVLNAVTRLEGTEFGSIAPNDFVEVSGFIDDRGAVRATFLEKSGVFVPGTVVEVTGHVFNLNTQLQTFAINNLTVNYGSVASEDLLSGLSDNLLIEVEGTLDAGLGELLATNIRLGDEPGDGNADQIEVLGFVTDVVSYFEFVVGNQTVRFDENTLFVDGTPADILLGAKLEAEGSLTNGILMANEIEFWGPDQIEIEGFVTDISSDTEFTVGNQVVQTDADTVFESGTMQDIAPGILIEIKGVPTDIDLNLIFADKVSFE